MNKTELINFINYYRLNGTADSVIWEIQPDTITARFKTELNSIIGIIIWKTDSKLAAGKYGVFDTGKLLKLLGVLSDDITIKPNKNANDKTVSLNFTDQSKTKVLYSLTDPLVFDKVPTPKSNTVYGISLTLTQETADKLIKAISSLSDKPKFALKNYETLKCVEFIIGYDEVNTSTITIEIPTDSNTCTFNKFMFDSNILKEVLSICKKNLEIGRAHV